MPAKCAACHRHSQPEARARARACVSLPPLLLLYLSTNIAGCKGRTNGVLVRGWSHGWLGGDIVPGGGFELFTVQAAHCNN